MQLKRLKSPFIYIPLSLGVIIIISLIILFNSAFQTSMLVKYASPHVDTLAIDKIHLTPWSLRLNNLDTEYQGSHIQLESGEIRFCLTDLLFKKINIKKIDIKKLLVNLENQQPSPTIDEEKKPFLGILNSINQGYGYVLGEVFIETEIKLPKQQKLDLVMQGGEVKPEQEGMLITSLNFATGNNDDHIVVRNELSLDQISHGTFNKIEGLFDVELFLADLPVNERVSLQAIITPSPVDESLFEGQSEVQVELQNDAIRLAMNLNEEDENVRTSINIEAIYNSLSENMSGNYQLIANEKLIQPYLTNQKLPKSVQTIKGDFNYLLADNTGDVTILGELQLDKLQSEVDSEKVPDFLALKNDFQIRMLPDNELQISVMKAGVAEHSAQDSLRAHSPKQLTVPLNDIDSFLAQDNTLLEIEVPKIPLVWFDFLVPEYEITGGYLSTAFTISTTSDSSIHLQTLKPLAVDSLNVMQSGKSIVEDVNISISPAVTYHDNKLAIVLSDLIVANNKKSILDGSIKTNIVFHENQHNSITLSANTQLNTKNALALIDSKANYPQDIPRKFSANINSSIELKQESLAINRLDLNVGGDKKANLIALSLVKPIGVNTLDNRLNIPAGRLATLALSDINLGWLTAFIPSIDAAGVIQRANFNLAGDEQRHASLTATSPLKINNISISQDNSPILDDINLSILPIINISDRSISVDYQNLLIQHDNYRLIEGAGLLTFPTIDQGELTAAGDIKIDLQAASQQPVLADILQGNISSALSWQAKYALDINAEIIHISQLQSNLYYADQKPRITLAADSDINIRTTIANKQNADFTPASGEITLEINELDSTPFEEILKANNIGFEQVNGKFNLKSNGNNFTINTIEALKISGVSFENEQGAILNPFSVSTGFSMRMDDKAMQVSLNDYLMLMNQQANAEMIRANINLDLVNGKDDQFELQKLQANIAANLPILLGQPVVLPGHNLNNGLADVEFSLLANSDLKSLIRIHDLKSDKALPLDETTIKLEGQWHQDGSFNIAGPISTHGKTGESHINLELIATKWQEENRTLDIDLLSDAFFLNDILNTLNVIKNQKTSAEEDLNKNEPASHLVDELVADERAFWDSLPYQTDITFKIDELFYTDYLVINSIQGDARLTPELLSLNNFSAFFHDSPLKVESLMTFAAGSTPYDLNLDASITQFDLTTFLSELVPGASPRAEGLFDISFNASGQSPNITQYRNELLFDMRLHSENGLFRLLDPDSALIGGSTSLLGTVGEGISYVPTGLFGVGAVSRLVKYIKVVDYDLIDIHLLRDESRNLVIEKYRVKNSELLMTAEGGVDYVVDQDVLHSPLSMDAQLSFRGHGAAIMYDLNLLEKEKNIDGYWLGPKVSFSGTMTNSTSNLDEVISTAGNGAVLGGITRPISGLIGNIKYRWFDKKEKPDEEKR